MVCRPEHHHTSTAFLHESHHQQPVLFKASCVYLKQVLDDWQRKSQRLARARPCAAYEVAPRLGRLEHVLLDGEQCLDVARFQGSNSLIRQPDVGHLHQTSEVRNEGPALYTDHQVKPWSRCSLMHTAHDMQRLDADT